MRIVPMEFDQVDAVAAIEAKDGDVHWSRANFEKELQGEFKRFFLAMESEDVLGYGGYWKADSEAQITNVVVRQESRCQGIGKRLVEFILDCARGEMCNTCTLEVRKSNAHAQTLYQSLGFKVKGIRPKIYQNPVDDAVLMEKIL
jgi:ribosomal-protein-alanine N-acetyltransferase